MGWRRTAWWVVSTAVSWGGVSEVLNKAPRSVGEAREGNRRACGLRTVRANKRLGAWNGCGARRA